MFFVINHLKEGQVMQSEMWKIRLLYNIRIIKQLEKEIDIIFYKYSTKVRAFF